MPRTITSLESTRRSTGTVIADGSGAAVSAATWPEERISRPAIHATTASTTINATPSPIVRFPARAFMRRRDQR